MIAYVVKDNGRHKGQTQFKSNLAVGQQNIRSLTRALALLNRRHVVAEVPGAAVNLVAIRAQHAVDQLKCLPQLHMLYHAGVLRIQFALLFPMLTEHLQLSDFGIIIELWKIIATI